MVRQCSGTRHSHSHGMGGGGGHRAAPPAGTTCCPSTIMCVCWASPPVPIVLGLCPHSLLPRALSLVIMMSLMASKACYNSLPCMQSLAMPHLCWSLGPACWAMQTWRGLPWAFTWPVVVWEVFHAHSGEREQFPDAGDNLFNLSTQHQLFNDGWTHAASPT